MALASTLCNLAPLHTFSTNGTAPPRHSVPSPWAELPLCSTPHHHCRQNRTHYLLHRQYCPSASPHTIIVIRIAPLQHPTPSMWAVLPLRSTPHHHRDQNCTSTALPTISASGITVLKYSAPSLQAESPIHVLHTISAVLHSSSASGKAYPHGPPNGAEAVKKCTSLLPQFNHVMLI